VGFLLSLVYFFWVYSFVVQFWCVQTKIIKKIVSLTSLSTILLLEELANNVLKPTTNCANQLKKERNGFLLEFSTQNNMIFFCYFRGVFHVVSFFCLSKKSVVT